MFFTASSSRNIVCDSDPDAVSRYIEQLISRSNSWRPDLDAIEEILSHSSTCTNGDAGAGAGGGGGGGGGVHLILHMDEEVVRVRDQNQILPPVPTLTKASSRWPAERRDRVMSSIIWF